LFSILTTRLAESVGGLDSSLAHLPGEHWIANLFKIWGFCETESVETTVLKNDCSKFNLQRGQWLSFPCFYVVCELEKTICPLHR